MQRDSLGGGWGDSRIEGSGGVWQYIRQKPLVQGLVEALEPGEQQAGIVPGAL